MNSSGPLKRLRTVPTPVPGSAGGLLRALFGAI